MGKEQQDIDANKRAMEEHNRIWDLQSATKNMNKAIAEWKLVENVRIRQFALDNAQKFFSNPAHSPGGIINAAAILNVADMYAAFVKDGTLPDMAAHKASVAQFSTTVAEAMFGPFGGDD